MIKGVGILLNLPYYYGRAGEQYAFFRIPKLLLTDERLLEVSTDAKLLYGYCLTVWSCLIETAGSTSRTVSLLSLQQRKSCLPCTAVLRKRHGSLLNWTVPRASAWSNVNGKGWDGLRWFMWKTSLVHDLFCLKLNVPFLRKCYAISRDSKSNFKTFGFRTSGHSIIEM